MESFRNLGSNLNVVSSRCSRERPPPTGLRQRRASVPRVNASRATFRSKPNFVPPKNFFSSGHDSRKNTKSPKQFLDELRLVPLKNCLNREIHSRATFSKLRGSRSSSRSRLQQILIQPCRELGVVEIGIYRSSCDDAPRQSERIPIESCCLSDGLH